MPQYEWIIIEVLVVALLVWELVRTRRAIGKARAEQELTSAAAPETAASPAPTER
jgi:hypothetical protein